MSETPRITPPRTVIAPPGAGGERLDRFLTGRIGGISRTRVKALILCGSVRCNGELLTDPAASVHATARYTVAFPPPKPAKPRPQAIPLTILYEDDELIVLDKPAGLVVHPAPGNPDGTLVNALIAHLGSSLQALGDTLRPGIVHRLDKDTSGVMVVAKSPRAEAALSHAFATRTIDRAYIALLWGLPTPAAGEYSGPIGRDPRNRKRMAVRPQGKPALTHYRLLRSWFGAVAFVECRLGSGRTHQIRVHMAHAGHPLIGDPVYIQRRPKASHLLPDEIRDICLDFPHQALHAARLGFQHPLSGEKLVFTAAPPADFTTLLAALDRAEKAGESSARFTRRHE